MTKLWYTQSWRSLLLYKGGKLPMVTVEVVTIGNALTLLYANILLQWYVEEKHKVEKCAHATGYRRRIRGKTHSKEWRRFTTSSQDLNDCLLDDLRWKQRLPLRATCLMYNVSVHLDQSHWFTRMKQILVLQSRMVLISYPQSKTKQVSLTFDICVIFY